MSADKSFINYENLSKKDKRFYAKFKRIAELNKVHDEQGVKNVVSILSSPLMKAIPNVAFGIAIACCYYAVKDIVSGNIPIILPVFCMFFLWVCFQNIRTINVTMPMIAEIYSREGLIIRKPISKKSRKRLKIQSL